MAVCRRSSPASAAPRELFPAARDRFLTAFLAVFFRPVFFRMTRFFWAFFFGALLRPDFFIFALKPHARGRDDAARLHQVGRDVVRAALRGASRRRVAAS